MAIEAKEKLYNIGPGFHSASTAERLDDLFDDQVIVECIIPKGSKYYRGLSGLLVSDRIIIKKRNMKWCYDKYGNQVEVSEPQTSDQINAVKTAEIGKLYGWNFKYNDFTKEWLAVEDEHRRELTNNYNSEHILRSKSIKTLEGLVNKYKDLSALQINKLYE